VGVWVVQKPLVNRTTGAIDKASRVLEWASENVTFVHDSLARARKDLNDFRVAARKNPAPKPSMEHRMIARQIDSRVQNAGATVDMVTDTAVVLNSLLGGLNELPDTSITTLDTDRLREMQGSLSDLARSSKQLGSLLDQGGMDDSDAQAAKIDELLTKAIELVGELLGRVNKIQSDVAKLQSRAPRWIYLGSIVITVVLGWIAISQLCVLGYAARWLKGRGE
jgi:hypothetical protein